MGTKRPPSSLRLSWCKTGVLNIYHPRTVSRCKKLCTERLPPNTTFTDVKMHVPPAHSLFSVETVCTEYLLSLTHPSQMSKRV